MITAADMPETEDQTVVFELEDGDTFYVTREGAGFYGRANKFDTSHNIAEEMVSELNEMGATVIGWE